MFGEALQRLRSEAPVVHNITNYVVMNTTANALLALGASPVMAHAQREVEEMVGIARALVLNIGTLSDEWVEAMLVAGRAARKRGIPIVLDPVGAGATSYRTETALRLLAEVSPTIVRGNASEIRALAVGAGATRGVDSIHASEESLDAAAQLSRAHGCVVSVSGATDLIVSDAKVARVRNGVPLMTRVTGTGCTATALTGAFAAVESSPFLAATFAMAALGVAGEMAAARAVGPGSLQVALLDALAELSPETFERSVRVDGV
ncbi:MAG TPA: hydroxyethylthiazole kinase [Polyangiaceae bacterium]|nr:hydroxyethylthiazole kinase [Polyangiaceae bacterium]